MNDISKYLLNTASSDKKFDKVKELLMLNKMQVDKINSFEKVFKENAQNLFLN